MFGPFKMLWFRIRERINKDAVSSVQSLSHVWQTISVFLLTIMNSLLP